MPQTDRSQAVAQRPQTRRFRSARLLIGCLLAGLMAPSTAFAHVKWFEDSTAHALTSDYIFSDRSLLWLATSLGAVLLLTFVQRMLGNSRWPALRIFDRMAVGAPTILAVQAAIALVAAASQSALLVPNLPLPSGPVGIALTIVEVLIAFSFITGIGDWIGAIALAALVPVAALLFSPMDALEQLLWVGIAAVVLVIGRESVAARSARPWFCKRGSVCATRAIVVLRVATGLALIALALNEKILNPELGHAFMIDHPAFNVVHNLPGLEWFTDDLFVLAIGLAEAAIGAALISGKMTRVVVLGAWVPFHLGIPLLPAQELIGHLPVFGIMYMLLVYTAPKVAPAMQPVRAAEAALSAMQTISGATWGHKVLRPSARVARSGFHRRPGARQPVLRPRAPVRSVATTMGRR